jgi:hypothetical protein
MLNKPQPSILLPNGTVGNQPNNATSIPNDPFNQQQLDMYEQDRQEVLQRDPSQYAVIYRELPSIQYNLPSLSGIQGTEHYKQALTVLNNMLNGKEPMDLEKALFIVENAYFEGHLDYQKYDKEIQSLINIAKLKAMKDGFDWKDPFTRNMMLFRVMADTLKVKDRAHEGYITSYPMRYDFDDFMGKEDHSKMFVSKLLYTHSGQCHSMPLLFLTLAQKTNTKAYLSFSPSHSYVRLKDQMNNWYNLELTNGMTASDNYILGSGYVKSEAVKNHIYMDTVNTKQTIAYCIADLARGYIKKYGYDDFVKQCIDTSLSYFPNDIVAIQTKADYYSVWFDYVINQTGHPRPEILQKYYPKAYELLVQRNKLYETVDNLGYTEMPEEAYKEWLQSISNEKQKQENKVLMLRMTRTMK